MRRCLSNAEAVLVLFKDKRDVQSCSNTADEPKQFGKES